ncbi:MAG TPA: glycosyltransferase family A protein [Chitinophagaceae bacterium]|nr:glycosyltransferase family A protein [Chitinophagaceae bacterium]
MEINILISTIDKGIEQASQVLLEPRSDVSYIISHQYTDKSYKYIPDCLKRPDVMVSQIPGQGVTKSRNNAIKLADGDIGLFADDDVTYRHSDIDVLKKTFQEHEQADVAIFKIRTPRGEPEYNSFPRKKQQFKNKAPNAGTVQIAFNIMRIKENRIWFDERFGVGNPLLIGGEERLFLHDCIKAGLQVFFFPEYVVEHPYMSTIKGIARYDKRKNWITGGTDGRINGPIAFLKAFGGTVKLIPDLIKNGANPVRYLYHRISATRYILRTNKNRHHED